MFSPPLRIEPRPSMLLRVVLLILAALATVSLLLSAVPAIGVLLVPVLLFAAWPRKDAAMDRTLVFRSDGTVTAVDGDGNEHDLEPKLLQRRGPLTLLTMLDGEKLHRWLWLPDTLDAQASRRLGLWFAQHLPANRPAGDAAHV
jgi:hypothetical protein